MRYLPIARCADSYECPGERCCPFHRGSWSMRWCTNPDNRVKGKDRMIWPDDRVSEIPEWCALKTKDQIEGGL
jgi:hypothetical protein